MRGEQRQQKSDRMAEERCTERGDVEIERFRWVDAVPDMKRGGELS